jgi:hypothetical protein
VAEVDDRILEPRGGCERPPRRRNDAADSHIVQREPQDMTADKSG